MKTEPGTFSIDDLRAARGRRTAWDGVRNFQVRNFMRDEMRKGDLGFFYHSSCATPGIVGIVEIVKEGYPDSTAFDADDAHYDPASDPANPRWYMVDVKLVRKLKRVIELAELKQYADSKLDGFRLLARGNRLSIVPVTRREWNFILALE